MYLKPGETVTTVNLQGPDAGVYEAFQKNSLINMAGAMKLPFFLFYSDWAQINFSSAKAGLNRYKVTLTDTQNFDNDKLLRPIYINFINELMNRYPEMFNTIEDVDDVYCYEFFGPVIPDVDLAKETAATVEMLNNKLTSRTEYFSSRGMNFEDQMKLIANEEKFMTSLGLSVETTSETSATMFEPAVSEEEPIQTQTDEQIPNTNIND
jgi:capsid protein